MPGGSQGLTVHLSAAGEEEPPSFHELSSTNRTRRLVGVVVSLPDHTQRLLAVPRAALRREA
jgi:hypothetical protein